MLGILPLDNSQPDHRNMRERGRRKQTGLLSRPCTEGKEKFGATFKNQLQDLNQGGVQNKKEHQKVMGGGRVVLRSIMRKKG